MHNIKQKQDGWDIGFTPEEELAEGGYQYSCFQVDVPSQLVLLQPILS